MINFEFNAFILYNLNFIYFESLFSENELQSTSDVFRFYSLCIEEILLLMSGQMRIYYFLLLRVRDANKCEKILL